MVFSENNKENRKNEKGVEKDNIFETSCKSCKHGSVGGGNKKSVKDSFEPAEEF